MSQRRRSGMTWTRSRSRRMHSISPTVNRRRCGPDKVKRNRVPLTSARDSAAGVISPKGRASVTLARNTPASLHPPVGGRER